MTAESATEAKACCAAAYSTDLVALVLGESCHPGGRALTRRLAAVTGLRAGQRVLDVASGPGSTAVLLAQEFGVTVDGVDLGAAEVERAAAAAEDAGLERSVRFQVGDAERLPFEDASFDAVICECAFCTFPDKVTAAAELARVLRPGGRIGLSDVTLSSGGLPAELTGLAGWVACLADARPLPACAALLADAGLERVTLERHDEALAAMIDQIRARLSTLRAVARTNSALAGVDFDRALELTGEAAAAAHEGPSATGCSSPTDPPADRPSASRLGGTTALQRSGDSVGDQGPGRMPRRGAVRTARLALLPASHTARVAVGLGRRLGGRPAELVAAEVQRRTAEQLFSTLGELKGGAMKFGQALSAMEAALPESLIGPYREALVRLQETAPPMPVAMVHRVLDESFPAGWRQRLGLFEDRPIAAASIGQVHRAVWSDGSPVAVKVQYPGAGDALVSDIGWLNRMAPLLRVAAPGLDAGALFAELRARLVDEVDYAQEAQAQTAFAEAFRDDPDVYVPEVIEVAERVLVTRWMPGTPLSKVIAAGSRADRDRCGLLLLRLLLSSPARAGRLHGDPHAGNFRLLPDGRLGVLDFGATEPLPRGWPRRLGPLLAALREEDAKLLYDIAISAGLVAHRKVDPAALLDLLGPYAQPLRQPAFHFSRSWLQAQGQRHSDPRNAAAQIQRRLSVPARHLLLQRVVVGLVGVLAQLDARVPVDAEVQRWVPGYS